MHLTLPKVQGQGERAIHTNGRSHKRIDVKIVIDRGGHNERICQKPNAELAAAIALSFVVAVVVHSISLRPRFCASIRPRERSHQGDPLFAADAANLRNQILEPVFCSREGTATGDKKEEVLGPVDW